MQTRLFHTIVIVGASLGAAATSSVAIGCGGSDETSTTSDAGSDGKTDTFAGIAFDSGKDRDTFPGISPGDGGAGDTGKVDATDADATDTFPTIAIDSGSDTFPGISPAADTFPGDLTAALSIRRHRGRLSMRPDGRWKGRLTSRPLPELDLGALGALAIDDETRSMVVRMWMGRSAAERRAADSFLVVRDALKVLGGDSESIALAERAFDDELRHAEICRVVASRFAGRELAEPERLVLDVPKHAGASPELRRSLHVFGQCALNETTASAFLELCLADSQVPLAHDALRELLSDEIDHARIGWAHLASLDAPSRAAVTPWLQRMMAANLAMWRASGAPPKPSAMLAQCGVPSKESIDAAVLGAVRDLVIPGLLHLGYEVGEARAWADAGAPT